MNTENYLGYDITIKQDTEPDNPRDWSNVGKMICFHRRHNLGDKHDYNSNDYNGWDEIEEQLIKDFNNDIILPIYMYEHSGATINTTGFNCPWDSGQVGWVIVNRPMMRACMGWRVITEARKEKLLEILRQEVSTYNQFLSGNVWGYEITKDGEHVNSCWGITDDEYCLNEAKSYIDSLQKQLA